jgi:uncharacterized protein YdiU (UPF0061 family)
MPVSPVYRADPLHPTLGTAFLDPVQAAAFPKAVPRWRNRRWDRRIGLDTLSDAEWAAHFHAFRPLPDNIPQPLALRYHGHQFQSYNPDIGDGRGFLFAQARDTEDGRLLDLATKGSGRTPWSRSGDGRLTLKGGVREVLATEMLEASGVYTSKSLSLFETGEDLMRGDEPSPTRSSVLVRLGHSHIRFGTFQRLRALGDSAALQALIDFSIRHYWPAATGDPDPVAGLFERVVNAVAEQAAEWFQAGFVHGVLNTDNTVITGESFDYGPWRFLPTLDPGFVAAYFDHTGLYAFGRQPTALRWNLARLAECLLPFTDIGRLRAGFERFDDAFERRISMLTAARLGLACDDPAAFFPLAQRFYGAMAATGAPFERVFFDLAGLDRARMAQGPLAALWREEPFGGLVAELDALPRAAGLAEALAHPYFGGEAPVTLLIGEVEQLWSPIAGDDDWSAFEAKIAAINGRAAAYHPLLAPLARAGHVPATERPSC